MTRPAQGAGAALRAPPTAMALWIGVAGALGALATLGWGVRGGREPALVALLALAAGFLPPLLFDGAPRALSFLASAGGADPAPVVRERLVAKMVGVVCALGLAAAAFVVFPFFHRPALDRLAAWAPAVFAWGAPAIVLYVAAADRLAVEPDDGLAALGRACLGRPYDAAAMADFLRTLVIKLFFFSLMFFYVAADVAFYQAQGLPLLSGGHAEFEKLNRLIFTLDATLAGLGYLATFKLFGWQVREADATASGWAACLACYEPFFPALANAFLAYRSPEAWGGALTEGSLAYWLWAGAILACNLVYLFSTVAFGPLFSNLTRRLIVTAGPYAWTKHPAYLSKNAGWWIAEAPGLLVSPPLEAVRRAAMLACVSAIYYARAVTEERLLRRDPVYRAYEAAIARDGLFARLSRLAQAPLRARRTRE